MKILNTIAANVLLCSRETHSALHLSELFFSFFSWTTLSRILGNLEQKTILQVIIQLIQYTVLEIQFPSLKYTAVIRIRKNLNNLPFLSKRYKGRTMGRCKQLYYKSILLIILLANVLANSCNEISKIRLI